MKPRVTVAVPVKDRRVRMLRCLEAILAQDIDDFEILVLDNESTDGTPEACRELGMTSRVPIRVEVVAGMVGHLRNRAADLAAADVIAFIDSDCFPAPDWLSHGLAAIEADDGLGILQGKTLAEPDVPLGYWPATIQVTEFNERFEGCNLFVRRQALADADGFDETISMWEDSAAGWSIMRNGWRSGWVEDAVVYHDVTHPGYRWHLRRGLRYGNAAAVARKYPELRRQLLWGRVFMRPRNAVVLAGVVGIALCPLSLFTLVLAVPWAYLVLPRSPSPTALLASGQVILWHLTILAGMVAGSVRHRSLVL